MSRKDHARGRESDMLVTTVREQRLIGRAARSAGGYFALASKVAEKRRSQKSGKKDAAGAKR